MTIDFWGLGLQAVNVLILIWLLSWVFWRPVAAAIANRQKAAAAVIETAQTTQSKAEAALAEAALARDGIGAERAATLDAARAEAATAAKATLDEARAKAEALLAAARIRIDADTAAAHKANARQASDLAVRVAAKLLARMDSPPVQSAFLHQLVKAIAQMPAADRAALADDPLGIEIVTATEPGAEQPRIETAVRDALGGAPVLRFVTDPALIAGLELRSPHFVLHNSWAADLAQIGKAMKDAL